MRSLRNISSGRFSFLIYFLVLAFNVAYVGVYAKSCRAEESTITVQGFNTRILQINNAVIANGRLEQFDDAEPWRSTDKTIKALVTKDTAWKTADGQIQAYIRIGYFRHPTEARRIIEELNGWNNGSINDLLHPGSFSGKMIGDACWYSQAARFPWLVPELNVAVENMAVHFRFFLREQYKNKGNSQDWENMAVLVMGKIAGKTSSSSLAPRILEIKAEPNPVEAESNASITVSAKDPRDKEIKYFWHVKHPELSEEYKGQWPAWTSKNMLAFTASVPGSYDVEIAVANEDGLMALGATKIIVIPKTMSGEQQQQLKNAIQRLQQPGVEFKTWKEYSNQRKAVDQDMYERDKAVLSIMDYGDASAVPLLLEHIGEKYNFVVRQNALRALGEMGTAEVIPVLDEFLKKPITGFDIGNDEITKNILIRHCADAIRKIKKRMNIGTK